jgi:hypothetical protein
VLAELGLIIDRTILGGFKWSSQLLGKEGYDEETAAAFGSVQSGAIVLTRSTADGRTR